MPFANHPKEEVVQMNRHIEIPSGHRRSRIVLRPKPKCQNGFFPTTVVKIQGLTQHWVFPTVSWKGIGNRVEWKEHGRKVRVWAANLILSLVLL